MANSVELLNSLAIRKMTGVSRLLEIGCGAYSLYKEMLPTTVEWEGIDVIDFDRKGQRSIATKKASVADIPWPNEWFDIVVANQSVEHWHEYGVDVELGLQEISRVLKTGGKALINFPVHLHGEAMFLLGDFKKIDRRFEQAGMSIIVRRAVVKSSASVYRGWRLCGFPDFIIKSAGMPEDTSYVVEYELCKVQGGARPKPLQTPKISKHLNVFERHAHYGMKYLAWKIFAKALRIDRG
jgi:SAM-dependent methyltransferase